MSNKPELDKTFQKLLKEVDHLTPRELAAKSRWISISTFRNWKKGKTRFPHHLSIAELARIAEREIMIVTSEEAHMIRNFRKTNSKTFVSTSTPRRKPQRKPKPVEIMVSV